MSRKALVSLVAAGGLLGAALTGCNDDSTSGAGDAPASDPQASEVQLTGEPVKIGVIYSEGAGTGLDLADVKQGADAAEGYLNDTDGIAGRPVEIVACNEAGDPATSTACGQEFVDEGVIAVVGLGTLFGPNGLSVIGAADIPFAGTPVSNEEFLAENSYPLVGGSAAAFPALVKYAVGLDIEKAAVLYADIGAAELAANALLADPLTEAGVDVTAVLPEALGAADFTPALVEASDGDPDVIFLLFPADDCNRIFTAAGQIGTSARLATTGACAETAVLEGVDQSVIDGLFVNAETVFYLPDDAEAEVYRAAVEDYIDDPRISGFSASTFAQVMTLKSIGDTLGRRLSAESVLDTLMNAEGLHVFMSTELDSSAPALLAGVETHVFNRDQRIVVVEDGELVDANEGEWIDGYE